MGASQIIIATGTALSRQEAFLITETGVLHSAAVISDELAPRPGQVWAEYGIMIGGRRVENRQAILGQGYVGTNSSLGWSGNIPLQPTMEIYLFIWSSIAFNVRLALITSPAINQSGV